MVSTAGQSNSFGPVAQQTQWQIKPTGTATLSWVKNNHTFKFGGEMRIESFPVDCRHSRPTAGSSLMRPRRRFRILATRTTKGGTLGFPYASFMLGYVNNGEIGQYSKFHLGKQAWSFFAQDSWKITPKLTLDYGLRYDYQTYLTETYGRIPSFGYQTPNPSYGNIPGAVIFERDGVEVRQELSACLGPTAGPGLAVYGENGASRRHRNFLWHRQPSWKCGACVSDPTRDTASARSERQTYVCRMAPRSFRCGRTRIRDRCRRLPDTVFMTSFDHNAGRPPRQVMWSFGIQRELSRNLSLDVSYVGNRGVWWNSNGSLTDPNRVTPAILAEHHLSLTNPDHQKILTTPLSSVSTADRATAYNLTNLLRVSKTPCPSRCGRTRTFGGIFVLWAPLGNTWYDSLQIKLTKRYSNGLDFTAAYTWQKEITIGAETFDPAFAAVGPAINDINNMKSNKTLSGLSVPHRLVIAANYTIPRFANMNKILSAVISNWQLGAVLNYQSGAPIHVPFAQTTPNLTNLLSLCAPQSVFGGCNSSAVSPLRCLVACEPRAGAAAVH